MTALADIVSNRLAEIGRGPAQAESIGKLGRNYISDIVRGKKADIRSKNVAGLAKALDWSTAEMLIALQKAGLRFGQGVISNPLDSEPGLTPSHEKAIAPHARYSDDVPVYGVAAASAAGSFELEEQIDAVMRPPALMRMKNLYALYVHGDSMSPRYRSGDLIFVSPDRPPRPGDDVIVQTRNHEAAPIQYWLKELDHITNDVIAVRQLSPSSKIDFKRPSVVGVHRVLTVRELFGA